MSIADGGSPALSLRRLPFTVRLSPQLLNQLLAERTKPAWSTGVSGLLFGRTEEGLVIAQVRRQHLEAGQPSSPADRSARKKAFDRQVLEFQKQPEIAGLNLIGWYAIREGGGLSVSDVAYHDEHFPNPNDLVLILKPEGESDVSLELYCRTVAGALTADGHRIGVVRLSTAALESPVEVVPRSKIQDDFFMRAYDLGDAEEGNAAGWKGTLAIRYRKAFSFLHPGSEGADAAVPAPEENQEPPREKPEIVTVPIPPASPQKPLAHPAIVSEEKATIDRPITAQPAAEKSVASVSFVPAAKVPAINKTVPFAPDPPAASRNFWLPVLSVFLLTSLVTFGVVYYLRSSDRLPQLLNFFASHPTLGLRVDAQGDRLLVSWNRQHPLVLHAKSGSLVIQDGAQKREVPLDAAQVANGAILYRPKSDDVAFRLQVTGVDGNQAVDSMRVLEASKPAALDISPETPAGVPAREKQPKVQPKSLGSTRAEGSTPASAPPPVIDRAAKAPASETKLAESKPAETQAANTPSPLVETAKKETSRDEEVQAIPEDSAPPKPLAASADPVATDRARLKPQVPADLPQAHGVEQPKVEQPKKEPLPVVKTPNNLASYQPSKPLRQVLPNLSVLPSGVVALAGRLEVLVSVDETGKVTDARAVPDGRKLNTVLIGTALNAARQWKFSPAVLRGRPIPSQHSIVFQFTPRR